MVDSGLKARVMGVVNSASLKVIPFGGGNDVDRGVLGVRDLGRLHDVVKLTFAAAVVAMAMSAPGVAQAQGLGYDAGVYGQAQGQVMQTGTAIPMQVLGVRQVDIEVAAPVQQKNNALGYAVVAAGTTIGGIAGSKVGGGSGSQIATILGALAGGVAADMANDTLNAPARARHVPGVEITMVNPANNQIAVVTQAGNQQFEEGDRVLVTSVGGSTRVVLDRSRAREEVRDVGGTRPVGGAQQGGGARSSVVSDVVRYAAMMGLEVSAVRVADLVENGAPDRGRFVGNVVGIDRENGFVYQAIRKGVGVVHDIGSLTRVPEIGENVTVVFKDGRGIVEPRVLGAGKGMERG